MRDHNSTLRDLGCWLVRPSGQIIWMPKDPESEYYFEPQPMPEKRPAAPTEMTNVNDAYRRFTLRDGPLRVGVFYARNELSAEDKVRLVERMYSKYGKA